VKAMLSVQIREKKVSESLGAKSAKKKIDKATIIPHCVAKGIVSIGGLASKYSRFKPNQTKDLPDNCFIISSETTKQYHGCLASHPISSPVINVNLAPLSYLQMILIGTKEKTKEPAEGIIQRRKANRFKDLEELENYLHDQFEAEVRSVDKERIMF